LQERARENNNIAVQLLLNRTHVAEGMQPAVGV
jgi:hypothetical protein